MLRRIVHIIIIVGFVLLAGIWIAQSYTPIVLYDSFSNDFYMMGHVLDEHDLVYSSRPNQVGASCEIRAGDDDSELLSTQVDHGELLPAPGDRMLIDLAHGRLHVIRGTISVATHPEAPHVYATRRIATTSQRSIPVWPVLLLFGLLTALLLGRFGYRRRARMMETYRAANLHTRQIALSLVLLSLCCGLYLAQRIRPRALYNQLTAVDDSFKLTAALQWNVHTFMDARGLKSYSYTGTSVAWPEEPDDTPLEARDYWLVVLGGDALRFMRSTVSFTPPAVGAGPTQVVVAFPTSLVTLPLWLGILVFAGWFVWLAVVPSMTYFKRKRSGLCLNCGYDLRESPQRCPECGTLT